MANVGLGQLVVSTGRYISRKTKDSVTDNNPVMRMLKEEGGIRRIDGGRTVVEEALTGQNLTPTWVGEKGQAPLTDQDVLDAPEFPWKYQLASVSFSRAEQYKNSGGSDTKLIDLVSAKWDACKASMVNQFHEGIISDGTLAGGLGLGGLALLVSKTPSVGIVGGIDRSNPNAAWFRNQAFNTATSWGEGPVDSGNVKRFLDKGINSTVRDSDQPTCFLMGQTHWEAATTAFEAQQMIMNQNGVGKLGFQAIEYRGIPIFYGGGLSFSGRTQLQADRTYLLNLKRGYLNLVFHEKAEFDMLEETQAHDQAVVSRLMFTMATMTLGFAAGQWTGYDS